ncbi:helix-turn-helix domain-containing protein [Actinoplanes sp. L3-i22]|uniref:helix-turn-helix domain-containing protein n=1 Tax=Actinoplanes sp. L3-i22 TaxID=2836373 RepID=UPI001C73EE05|nr:helix-turn-helix transcriptional regulator [Actinoplanes sp. L3-i22]BCY07277.1 hypothetical protein L3i22_023650 [Actinoplanes sp. L3-i22]
MVDYEGPLQVAAGTPGNHRFGAILKSLRERSGLSPQQLADQTGVHVSFVRGIERGAQAPSVATARPLLAYLGDQDRIRWLDGDPCDLLVRDPESGRDVAFTFQAKVKGQNRRASEVVALTASTVAENPGLLALVGALAAVLARKPALGSALASMGMEAVKSRTTWTRSEAAESTSPSMAEAKPSMAEANDGVSDQSAPADGDRWRRVMVLLAAADDDLLARVERLLADQLVADS